MVLHPFHYRDCVQFPWDFEYKCSIYQRTQILYPTLSLCTFFLAISFFPCTHFFQNEFHVQLKNNDFTKRDLILFLVSEHECLYLSYSNQFNTLPSLSNNSANPSASYSARNARSFSPWIWYGVTAWTGGVCISHCSSLLCCCHAEGPLLVFFWCIYPKVKSQFWMKQRLWGVLIQHHGMGCKLTKS